MKSLMAKLESQQTGGMIPAQWEMANNITGINSDSMASLSQGLNVAMTPSVGRTAHKMTSPSDPNLRFAAQSKENSGNIFIETSNKFSVMPAADPKNSLVKNLIGKKSRQDG
jgi:hypothetical protein